MANWFSALGALVEKESGERKSGCVVVIPSADATSLLDRHLAILARQTTPDFDVLILGKKPGRVPSGMNALVYREKYPLGSSGGFGVGRALAYSLGYEYILNADVDCTPISSNLIERLKMVAGKEQKAVYPKSVESPDSEIRPTYVTNQYGIITRKVLQEAGFDNFRLYRGSEDYDMRERLLMEGKSMCDDSVRVQHKSHNFDYIPLLNFPGNKYIYYKRSFALASVLLAGYSLRRGRLLACARYASVAFMEMVKTQLFYSQHNEIISAVWHGLIADMGSISVGRTTPLKTIALPKGASRLLLSTAKDRVAKGQKTVCFSPQQGGIQLALKMLEAALCRADFSEPTTDFLENFGRLQPLFLLMRPFRFEGKTYSCGMGRLGIILNALYAAALSPLYALAIAFGVIRASSDEFPIRAENMRHHMQEFLAYLKKFLQEKQKLQQSA